MSNLIYFGANLNFARYVWGPEASLDIVKDHLGLRIAEPVAENDFGPALYLLDREAFIRRHEAVGHYARENGIYLPTVFTFYRDGGAVADPDEAVRRAALEVLSSLVFQAKAVGASYACAALMTANREDFKRDPSACRRRSLEAWTTWMEFAHTAGLKGLLLEMSAQAREDCATIAQARATLQWLRDYHLAHPETTAPVELCYDLGHGISRQEAPDDAERDFRSWFRAFPNQIREIHVKNTDPDFLATWPFTPQYQSTGIIQPLEVVEAIRDLLKGEVYLMLEIAGKRGRTIGEDTILEDLKVTVQVWQEALHSGGYRPRSDGAWMRGKPPV